MNAPDRLAEIMARDMDWLLGAIERLREVETDWSRVREELTNAKRAIANITQRLDLKLDELSKQDAEIARLRGLLERLATETLLARAVIHEIAWGQIVVITEHPQLRAMLEAWGQEDKIDTPELQRLAAELRST
jgi:chromosome segregation ATPase